MARTTVVLSLLCCFIVAGSADLDNIRPVVEYFAEKALSAVINTAAKELSNVFERPYMTSMRMKPSWWRKSLYCDSAVVGDRWVMTSGRCCVRSCGTPYTPSQVFLRSESTHMKSEGVEHKVNSVHLMDNYNINSMDNNLCLLEISGSFGFGSKMKAVEMALDEADYTDEYARISGWSNKDGTFSDQISTMTMPLISNTKCQEMYAASGKSASDITENMFCTMASGQNVCHGEGGSPLLINGKLAGIVAAGSGCGNNPGIFTKVNKYLDWIKQHVVDTSTDNIDIRSNF